MQVLDRSRSESIAEETLPARLRLARPAWIRALSVVVGLSSVAGCTASVRNPAVQSADKGFFGWHFHAPFDTSEVKTVAVFFRSQSFRRDIEKQLTEAVEKEITLRTPFKVVGNSEKADSLLSGVITYADKNLVVESPTNLPRGLNATITISTNWTHNPPTEIEAKRIPTVVAETINFFPEAGETSVSAFNHVIQSLAKQIVDMMEQPWFRDEDLQ
jgi:hypothetical protein